MPGFQGKNLLSAHSGSKHQSDAETHTVFRQFFHEDRYLFRGEGILPLDGFPVAHLLCEANWVLSDEIVGFGLVHDLIHHSTALSQIVKRASVMAKLLQHHFDVEGFDVPDLPAAEKRFECTQRIFVVFLRGGHDIVFVAFKPHVGPFLEGIDHIHLNALGLGALVRFGFVFDFFLSLAIKAFVFASSVIMETDHQTQFPCAVWTLTEMAVSVRPSFCHAYSFLWHRRFAILL